MPRKLTELTSRPTCPDHPGSKVYVDRYVRRWGGYHQARAFRCIPQGGQRRHLLRPTLRAFSDQHPEVNRPCPHCGSFHEGGGPVVERQYLFSNLEIARALIRVGRGDSYRLVAAGTRREVNRFRLPARKWVQRRNMMPRGQRQPMRRKSTVSYDYHSPKQPLPLVAPVSRSASLITGWVDTLAPIVLDAFAYPAWPTVIALDSKPLKRRAIVVKRDKKTGRKLLAPATGGERNGEVLVAMDATQKPAVPCLIGLEGGKDHQSWHHFFGRLPVDAEPTWIVADLDSGIEKAVAQRFPNAVYYRCHEHLKRLIRKALAADGVPQNVEVAQPLDPAMQPSRRKGRSRAKRQLKVVVYEPHRLYRLVDRCLSKPVHWRAFVKAVEKELPPGSATQAWIDERGSLVAEQFRLRKRNPTMPVSVGAVESVITKVGDAVEKRSEFMRNAGRLDKLLGLIRLEAMGLANERVYADLIGRYLAAHPDRLNWVEARDVYGTCSIDAMIDVAMAVQAAAASEADYMRRAVDHQRRTAEVEARIGKPTKGPKRIPRKKNPSLKLAGLTVADIPGIADQWAEDLNGGKKASEVLANSNETVTWRCRAHEDLGHVHEFRARIASRCRLRPACPMCAHRVVCPATSLAAERPDIAKEWLAERNPGLDPTTELAKSGKVVWWKCEKPEHVPFRQRISQRALQHAQCPECGDDAKRRHMSAEQREVARRRVRRAKAERLRAA